MAQIIKKLSLVQNDARAASVYRIGEQIVIIPSFLINNHISNIIV